MLKCAASSWPSASNNNTVTNLCREIDEILCECVSVVCVWVCGVVCVWVVCVWCGVCVSVVCVSVSVSVWCGVCVSFLISNTLWGICRNTALTTANNCRNIDCIYILPTEFLCCVTIHTGYFEGSSLVEIHSFSSLSVCLTAGPKPFPTRALYILRSKAPSFRYLYPLFSLRSFNNFPHLLPRLPVTSILPFIFPSITRRRRQFLHKMWPIQLALC
jgi:hypothetical protein